MTINVFNTLSRKLEPLTTLKPGQVSLFVCGPTVYDYAHLGHGKTYTQFDFIARYLKYRGYEVTYLQNITDIDDKIIARAAERNIEYRELAEEFRLRYLEDMCALHNVSVNVYARCQDYIEQIVSQVQRLLKRGAAYKISDGYYFDIKSFKDYGNLSGRFKVEPEDSVSRIDENIQKKNSGDFCLWKFRKPGEPYWRTDLGEGRPGWHIEDTAITEWHFGPQYDIHGGAIDLIFPHHEAEIAVMEMTSGKSPMVRQWLHTGFLNTKSEKMSKSAGNFITIREALKKTHYRVLRYFFLSSHYRSSVDLDLDLLDQAGRTLKRIDVFLQTINSSYDDVENESKVVLFRKSFVQYLDNDFDTPGALALLFNFIREQNRKGIPGKRVLSLMKELNEIFDFFQFSDHILDEEVNKQIQLREKMRVEKRFEEADDVRDKLAQKGIILEDTASGVRWRRKE